MWDVVGRGSAGLGGAVRGAWARWRGWGRRERWMNRGKGCGRGDVGAGVAVRRTARGCGLVHRVGRTRTRAVDGLGRWAGGRARRWARGRALGFAHPGDGHAWDGCSRVGWMYVRASSASCRSVATNVRGHANPCAAFVLTWPTCDELLGHLGKLVQGLSRIMHL